RLRTPANLTASGRVRRDRDSSLECCGVSSGVGWVRWTSSASSPPSASVRVACAVNGPCAVHSWTVCRPAPPSRRASADFPGADAGMHSANRPLSMNERPRLLIVDDERGVRESLRAILQGECEVLTASSGDEALAIVGREPVDVLTLDLKMPGLGGIGVLERIKEIDPDIEVLII